MFKELLGTFGLKLIRTDGTLERILGHLKNTIYLKVMEKYNPQYLSKPGTAENSHRLTKQSLTGRETKT